MPNPSWSKPLKVIALASLAGLAACSSNKPLPPPAPLSGERLLRESESMQRLGQRYMDGERMVKQGEEMVRQGQARITEGERLIGQGQKIMEETEQGYGAMRR